MAGMPPRLRVGVLGVAVKPRLATSLPLEMGRSLGWPTRKVRRASGRWRRSLAPRPATRFRVSVPPRRPCQGRFVTMRASFGAGPSAIAVEKLAWSKRTKSPTPARSAFFLAARTAPLSRSLPKASTVASSLVGNFLASRRASHSAAFTRVSSKAKLRRAPGATFLLLRAASIAKVPDPQKGSRTTLLLLSTKAPSSSKSIAAATEGFVGALVRWPWYPLTWSGSPEVSMLAVQTSPTPRRSRKPMLSPLAASAAYLAACVFDTAPEGGPWIVTLTSPAVRGLPTSNFSSSRRKAAPLDASKDPSSIRTRVAHRNSRFSRITSRRPPSTSTTPNAFCADAATPYPRPRSSAST
mmetsp:Transcript_35864/g.114914  ORF Transcript_35864/g.114914 Transcript_35864/m.114914 type:complete len:353 (-) Transcript_35864:1447-2505(-)